MTKPEESGWAALTPPLRSSRASTLFREHARALARVSRSREGDGDDVLDEVRTDFLSSLESAPRAERSMLKAAGLVLWDLTGQGWGVRLARGNVEVRPPDEVSGDRSAEKARIRRQELLQRDAQLRVPSVQRFIREMEEPRMHKGRMASIFSVMRDGRELARSLRQARQSSGDEVLRTLIDPYLEFVTEDAVCQHTGLRLIDVWRYFRHTWTNQYKSVPGRTMSFLVRDRAAPFHPVVGIAALSSPVMQIRERDLWVGWHPDAFLSHIKSTPSDAVAKWLVEVVAGAIGEIFIEDLVADDLLRRADISNPSDKVIEALLKEAVAEKEKHFRLAQAADFKRSKHGDEDWVAKAKTHLFRSKRAQSLATYLRGQRALVAAFGRRPTAAKLAALASTSAGSDAIRSILKKAKADRVGICVADISVCGAVQPYNAILGGKCVAVLATSPEVSAEYRRRYSAAQSEIASSMAGRPIVRQPELVLLGTTSLYGVGSSQYNRLKIPCEAIGGRAGEELRYADLGHSESFGTSQYSEETVSALKEFVQQTNKGQRVNSIFGEGHSPKMRHVRQGLDALGFPSGDLLRHHRHRVVYGVSLVRNLREFLLGLEDRPDFLLPVSDGPLATAKIGSWWRQRWLRNRILSDEVLAEVAVHSLVRPIRHGARVVLKTPPPQKELFPEDS